MLSHQILSSHLHVEFLRWRLGQHGALEGHLMVHDAPATWMVPKALQRTNLVSGLHRLHLSPFHQGVALVLPLLGYA